MRIVITTPVRQSIQQVWNGFTVDLFKQLSPPFPPVKVLRFEGSLTGNEVAIELNFGVFSQQWISKITSHHIGVDEIYFVDEGTQLPFFLRYWHHKHRLVNRQGTCVIIDEITFRTPSGLTDLIFYPILYAQFLYRKPIYRKIFS
ncbi:MAG: hypothetical protein U0Y10_15290 [Spirosomataceae bacterium]